MFGLEPTPFDLRLVAFRIPIRVHPSFWIISALLAWREDAHPRDIFLWVMCLFFSILVHELGHAVVTEAFGWSSEIILYWCGGVALSLRNYGRTPSKDIAIALAGPCAGFGLFGLVYVLDLVLTRADIWMNQTRFTIFAYLYLINLFWGLVNLLPVQPLDGGRVCQALLEMMRFRNPVRIATQISVLVAIPVSVLFFTYFRLQFAGFMFALLALQNLMSLQEPQY